MSHRQQENKNHVPWCARWVTSQFSRCYSPSVKKRRNNYSSGDVDEDIKKIQTGEISQDKAVHEYGITRQTLARKYRNKRYNVADKRPGYLPVLGEETEKDLVRW